MFRDIVLRILQFSLWKRLLQFLRLQAAKIIVVLDATTELGIMWNFVCQIKNAISVSFLYMYTCYYQLTDKCSSMFVTAASGTWMY